MPFLRFIVLPMIKKLKRYIQKWLRVFLGKLLGYDFLLREVRITFEENRIERKIQKEHIDRLSTLVSDLQFELAQIRSLTDIGVDVHLKSESWAVVCLRGKSQNYVQFFKLANGSVDDMVRTLKRFHPEEPDRIIFDTPHGMGRMLDERMRYL